ncbi:MAG TPA: hypothetical protein VNP71_03715 [Thermoplasmata archaeon]|nr:hypothetical protein [Thermoplasmata archaeon]
MDARPVRWWGWRVGDDGIVVLRALKRELDPRGTRNPGTLAMGSP